MIGIFDIEANGLELSEVDEIFCVELDTIDGMLSFGPSQICEASKSLNSCETLVGHNIICYDLPVLNKVAALNYKGKIVDTLVLSRLIYTNLLEIDMKANKLAKKYWGKHSLEAWGHRLGIYKGDYSDFSRWTPEMQEYCKQDVRVTRALYDMILQENYSPTAVEIEHEFQKIIHIQETNGILFDTKRAREYADRVSRDIESVKHDLQSRLPLHVKRGKLTTPKRNNRTLGYREGCDFTKLTISTFNPGSRTQIEQFFKQRYKWEPTVFTDNGNPKLDDEILNELPFEEAEGFARYFERVKILGYLQDGKNAWLKLVKNGRIYGRVITNGAVTGRCTHSSPNLAQVPSIRKYMGKECRSLFHSGYGWMVGADASGLELRLLAHYLAQYDGGKYAEEVVHGDIHTANQRAANLESRDDAKTFIYAFIYGAGNAKLGQIVTKSKDELLNKSVGKELRGSFLSKVDGLAKLIDDVRGAADYRGFLRGLDGRKLHIRSNHKALNTLLQGAGAIVMKKANILFWDEPVDCYQVLNVHDEWEVVTNRKVLTDEIGARMVNSIVESGKYFGLKIPLNGEYKIGKNWAEVH